IRPSLALSDCAPPALAPDPRSMQWQQDGELARADLDALVHALQQVECDHNSAELQRLGQIDPSAAA
ncbi:MAG: hypothetical protein ACPGSE_02600, partial [Synechococcus sp.]